MLSANADAAAGTLRAIGAGARVSGEIVRPVAGSGTGLHALRHATSNEGPDDGGDGRAGGCAITGVPNGVVIVGDGESVGSGVAVVGGGNGP